jgi:transcriptional regulator with XRE-family HTH domain
MKILPTDAELIQLLKESMNYKTDVELAGYLGVTKDTVSAIRNNRTLVGEGLRFTIMDKVNILDRVAYRKLEDSILTPLTHKLNQHDQQEYIGEGTLSLLERCSPKNLADSILKMRRRQKERWALEETEEGSAVTEDSRLLDLYMAFRGFTTDVQMAKELGIKRNTISMVRTGRSRLGPLPRLRIYRDVYDEDTAELEEALESSEALLRMVRKYMRVD